MADPDLLMPQFASWQKKEIELWLKKNGFPDDKIHMLFKVGLESGALLLNEVLLPTKDKLQEYITPVFADFPQIWIDAFWMHVTDARKQQNFTLLHLDEGGSSSFLSETIARTGRSLILKAVWPGTNQLVCIKCNQGAEHRFHNNEIQILKRLNDASVPNIPRLISTGTLYRAGESYSAFVTDLIGKSIDTMLPLPVTEVRNMASDILEALTKIHERNIVHSDVKPANIIRKWNDAIDRYKYYLIDYGFSFEIGTIKDDEWGCSVEYASVEMLRGNIPTIKDDLKALWYTVMHALIGQLPWQTLRKSSELTLWYKQGWKADLIALNQAPYTQLVNLYDNLDAVEPHEAWTKYLHAY